ncbi:MAG: ABC transporter permease [Pirellulales bacterium]
MKRVTAWLGEVAAPPLVFFALVVVAWQAATSLWEIPAYLVPSPERVLAAAGEHVADLARASLMTAGGALCGFLLSLIVGTAAGLVFSQSRIIERSFYPYAIFLQTVPIVAIAPLVVMWCGNGFGGVVTVAFILSLFPIVTNATAGLKRVDASLVELFEICNASRWQTLVKLRLPNSVPYLVAGARISCGLSVIGAIVGEIFAGYGAQGFGLGYLINMNTGNLDTAYAFAAVIAATLLSIAIFVAVTSLGATVLARWHIAAPRNDTTREALATSTRRNAR